MNVNVVCDGRQLKNAAILGSIRSHATECNRNGNNNKQHAVGCDNWSAHGSSNFAIRRIAYHGADAAPEQYTLTQSRRMPHFGINYESAKSGFAFFFSSFFFHIVVYLMRIRRILYTYIKERENNRRRGRERERGERAHREERVLIPSSQRATIIIES